MCSRAGVTMSATGRVENGAKRVDVTMLMLDRLRSNHEKELASLRREHAQHVADVLDVVHTKLAAVRQELVAARQEALAARELAARTCQQQVWQRIGPGWGFIICALDGNSLGSTFAHL